MADVLGTEPRYTTKSKVQIDFIAEKETTEKQSLVSYAGKWNRNKERVLFAQPAGKIIPFLLHRRGYNVSPFFAKKRKFFLRVLSSPRC